MAPPLRLVVSPLLLQLSPTMTITPKDANSGSNDHHHRQPNIGGLSRNENSSMASYLGSSESFDTQDEAENYTMIRMLEDARGRLGKRNSK